MNWDILMGRPKLTVYVERRKVCVGGKRVWALVTISSKTSKCDGTSAAH
jgi:hypothetical protein